MPNHLSATTLCSLSEFETLAESWNQLWEQSAARQPLSRCEGVSLWVRHFADAETFRAVLIRDSDGRPVGGLAYLRHSRFGLTELRLPVNCWANAGDLLIHSEADAVQIVSLIIQTLRDEGAALLSFDQIELASSQWQEFQKQLAVSNSSSEISRHGTVGVIDIGSDWQEYFSCLSGNHRSAVRRSEKKLRKQGQVELLRIKPESDQELEHWMRIAIRIENLGWKRESGTSIRATDGMEEYFLKEARLANNIGALELWFLTLDGEPIAFEYCHTIKQACLSYKIGYDPDHRAFGPGRLLRKMQLESLSNDTSHGRTVELDTMGVLCNAKAKWATRQYQTGTLRAAIGGLESRLLIQAIQMARMLKKTLKPKAVETETLQLGGSKFLQRSH